MGEENKPNSASEPEIVKFSEGSGLNVGVFLAWIALVAAIFATVFFWLADHNVKSALAEKNQEKDAIIAEISNSVYAEVEQKATDFRASITGLKAAKQDRYSYQEFLGQLYKKITNDVSIKSLSMNETGELSLDGTTSSYRTTGDLILALKSWPALTKVTLSSVSFAAEGDKPQVSFSITATVDKSYSLTKPAPAAESVAPVTESNADSTTATDTASEAASAVTEPSVSAVGE